MDTVYVFNPKTGQAMAELDCVVVRYWKLQRSQRPERAVLKIKATAYDGGLLEFRNIIVVVSDVVPTWVGYVSVSPADRRWKDGYIYITLFSAEYLLSLRRLASSGNFSGNALNVFTDIIMQAEESESMLLNTIDTSGGTRKNYTLEYKRQTAFDAINGLVNSTGNYWWIEARSVDNTEVSQAKKLTLVPRISRQRGAQYAYPLVEGTNLVNIEAVEVGYLANRIYVQGASTTNEDPIEVTVSDNTSISRYGLIEDVHQVRDTALLDDLKEIGDEQLFRRAFPRYSITADVLSTPYPRIGDKAKFELESSFYGNVMQTLIGFNATFIIKSVAYSPESQGVTIQADNIFWE